MLKIHPAAAPRLPVLYDFGTIGLVTGIVGSVVSAGSSLLAGNQQAQAGRAQQQEADLEAAQLAQTAGQERAAAQQKAIEQRRQARLAQSRNQAVAAASGGGATDPTVLALDSSLAGEGELNALTELYQGEAKARGLEGQAAATQYQGKLARFSGRQAMGGAFFGSGAGLLSGVGNTLLYKYG